MRAKLTSICSIVFILLVTTGMVAQAANLKDVEITDEFPLDRCPTLVTECSGAGCNQYLPLIEYRVWELNNDACVEDGECDEAEAVTVTIVGGIPGLQEVDGEDTRVMEERETVDGELTEVSRNFVNQCSNTQDVYYWGEDVCVVAGSDGAMDDPPYFGHYDCPNMEGMKYGPGAWRAGIADANPGILFPGGAFLVGARYFQEDALNAQDWAENAEMGLSIDDPATEDDFEGCVVVLDRNLLEDPKSKEADEKIYCPDIGIVQDEEMELMSCKDGVVDCAQ